MMAAFLSFRFLAANWAATVPWNGSMKQVRNAVWRTWPVLSSTVTLGLVAEVARKHTLAGSVTEVMAMATPLWPGPMMAQTPSLTRRLVTLTPSVASARVS